MEQWARETDADGEEMAKKVIEPLLNNGVYLKECLEELDGNAVKDGDKGVAGGVASLGADGKHASAFALSSHSHSYAGFSSSAGVL